MVDVAVIFTDVFGPARVEAGLSEKACVRGAPVSQPWKSSVRNAFSDTPAPHPEHTSEKRVSGDDQICVRELASDQRFAGPDTKTHETHASGEDRASALGANIL